MKQFLKNIFYFVCVLAEKIVPSSKGHVLMYHSFNLLEAFFNVTVEDFKKQIAYLQKNKYHVVSLREFLDRQQKNLPLKKYITITFDDGYVGLGEVITFLRGEGIPVTLFWPSGVADNLIRLSNGVEYKILSGEQLSELLLTHPELTIGSHGVTHREFTKISHDDLTLELSQSLKDVSTFTQHVPVVAYPRGKYNEKVLAAVKGLNYLAGLSTHEGGVDVHTNIFEVPRLTADSTVGMLAFRGKLTSLFDWYVKIFR